MMTFALKIKIVQNILIYEYHFIKNSCGGQHNNAFKSRAAIALWYRDS